MKNRKKATRWRHVTEWPLERRAWLRVGQIWGGKRWINDWFHSKGCILCVWVCTLSCAGYTTTLHTIRCIRKYSLAETKHSHVLYIFGHIKALGNAALNQECSNVVTSACPTVHIDCWRYSCKPNEQYQAISCNPYWKHDKQSYGECWCVNIYGSAP